MSEQHTLAIIIPYYKYTFFEQCLDSIYNQTNKNFTLYIFDDASPKSPIHLLRKLDGVINYHYHKFEKNLGGIDLVAHWNRCVQLTSESWIWLFGDDDYMSPKCVESFFNEVENGRSQVYKIPVNVIDEFGSFIRTYGSNSKRNTILEIIHAKLKGEGDSFIVEYIFSRNAYLNAGGFFHLPLGWGSDDISWLIFSNNAKISQLEDVFVNWRLSTQNVSSENYGNHITKLNALIEYGKFLKKYVRGHAIENDFAHKFETELYIFIKSHLFNQIHNLPIFFSIKYSITVDIIFRQFPLTWVSILKKQVSNAINYKASY